MRHSTWTETPESLRAGYQVHLVTAPARWSYHEHDHHGFCEFVYVIHGTIRQVISGRERTQQAGEIILIRAHDAHALRGADFSYMNIMFPMAWLLRFEQYAQLPGQARRLLKSEQPPAAVIPLGERSAFQALADELHASHTRDAGRQVFAHFLALTLSRYLAPLPASELPSDLPDWLEDTVRWIHQHHDTLPSLADVIAHSCRCQEHFTRRFSRHFGTSPSRYLGALRIDRAAGLLATTNLPVQEICYRLGFENESYFYRLFRRYKELTPLAYRRAHGPRSIQPHPV